jgi:hypothetical protein
MSKARSPRSPAPPRVGRKRAAVVERPGGDGATVSLRGKAGVVILVVNRRTGRLATPTSARVIDRGAERFAGPLKRLAEK